ncbi:hypothetical protein HDU89_004657 [Geranomyces variabilis]|nr:hypothetical protein HDU89_004657 [Geranomyces variabilis]
MQDLLSSGAWKLVPTSSGPTTPWMSVLERIAQTLIPRAPPGDTQIIDLRTSSPQTGKIPKPLAETYAALNDQRFAAAFPEHCAQYLEREKADGVAAVPGRKDIPLAYFEGARPIATQRKKREDSERIARNLVSALTGTIESLGRQQWRVPDLVQVYSAQSAGQYLVVTVLEHHGALFLHQMLAGRSLEEIDTARVQTRSSRKSNFMVSWHLSHARQEPNSEIENAPEADVEGRDVAQGDEDGSDGAEVIKEADS